MSVTNAKTGSESFSVDKKTDVEPSLEPLLEVNESAISEIFDRPEEEGYFVEIPPKIFSIKDVKESLTIEGLNNAIYELGVVNLCWPEITEPVFETRTCFPKSYYTNSSKERLLLAHAENFRRQYHLHFKLRVPLLLQAPNECGLQKMVCTTIRPTKLCYEDTNTWQGIATLVSDYFNYEPLTKPMLHVKNSSQLQNLMQRSRHEGIFPSLNFQVGRGHIALGRGTQVPTLNSGFPVCGGKSHLDYKIPFNGFKSLVDVVVCIWLFSLRRLSSYEAVHERQCFGSRPSIRQDLSSAALNQQGTL